jgi:PAS domain-containing protein
MPAYQSNQPHSSRKPTQRQARQFRSGQFVSSQSDDQEIELEILVPASHTATENAKRFLPPSNFKPNLPIHASTETVNYQQILNTANAAIFQFRIQADNQLFFDFVSAGTELILGYAPTEIQENPHLWRTQIWPADWEGVVMPALKKLFRVTQTDPLRYYKSQIEFRFRRKSGYPGWMTTTLSCRFNQIQNCWHLTMVQLEVPAVDLARRVMPPQTAETEIHKTTAHAEATQMETTLANVTNEDIKAV